MSSERNKSEPPSTADRLLAAARECILLVGWKRTTLTDVANRAGVSRMTVYRTYPDMSTLFADLMTQEWAELVAVALPATDGAASGPDRIATGVAGTVAALRANDLFRRAVDLDPEWLLPYLLYRRGRSQDGLLDVLVAELVRCQSEGSVRQGDANVLARTIVLAAHGHALSIATMVDDDATTDSLDKELIELVRRYLTP
jgi:AcrR family transcriptional regulator